MLKQNNSAKERKGVVKEDTTRKPSVQVRSSQIPKLRPRPASKVEINYIDKNKTISGRVTRKSVQINNNNHSSKSKIPSSSSVSSTIPRPQTKKVKTPNTNTTTASNKKPKTPGFLKPTTSSLAKLRKRPSLTITKSPSPARKSLKRPKKEKPNPRKMASKRESVKRTMMLDEVQEEDETEHDNHTKNNGGAPNTPNRSPDTTTKATNMDTEIEDLRTENDVVNEESFAQKCLIEMHTTPTTIHTTPLNTGGNVARRALLRTGKKLNPSSSSSILGDISSKINYSFGLDEDDNDDGIIPDVPEDYEIFSTPIRNFSNFTSPLPPTSSSQSSEDDSVYFTPCGEI